MQLPPMQLPPIEIIVAASTNGVIGRQGTLPWHLPDELQHFKHLTMGHTLVMGRTTWESIGRPLAGRASIILTRRYDIVLAEEYRLHPHTIAHSWKHALESIPHLPQTYTKKICVIGGAEIFREALHYADTLHYTHIHAEVQGDVFMPDIAWQQWHCIASDNHPADERHAYNFTMATYKRR